MPQTKREIDAILAAAGTRPRHRFGQNFMIEGSIVHLIADAGELESGETVIEVGPGTGTLTDELVARGVRVLAVEIDRDLAAAARERYAGQAVEVIEGDALDGKHALPPRVAAAAAAGAKLVANLPYNIASPLVVGLLVAGCPLLVFTVQKEVARRLAATPEAGKEYGPLSVVADSLADVEVVRDIPPAAFWPPPKITSSLVRMRRRDRVDGRGDTFGRFVTACFNQRRKTLRHPLAAVAGDPAGALLAAAGLTGDERPGDVPAELYRRMFAAFVRPDVASGTMTP